MGDTDEPRPSHNPDRRLAAHPERNLAVETRPHRRRGRAAGTLGVRPMSDALAARAAGIELLLLDVDGVLTDGGIVYADDGTEIKRFHVRDGSGLKLWQLAGKRAAIVSGRSSPVV